MRKIIVSFAFVPLLFAGFFSGGASGCGGTASPAVEQFLLTVVLSGSGTVTSSPAGIDCGSDCSESFESGTEVVFTAIAGAGYFFSGWSGGGCGGTSTCTVSLSADTSVTAIFGRKIVFESARALDGSDAANTNSTFNVWVINADGTEATPLTGLTTNDVDIEFPEWSPDRTQISFDSGAALDGTDAANSNFTYNVWVVNADGTGLTPLTEITAAGGDSFSAQWSPDGSKLVFTSRRALDGSDAANTNNTLNIWVVNPDGTGPVPLTDVTAAEADCSRPQWSPDGTKIVFSSNRAIDGSDALNANSAPNVWVIDADGSGLTPLTRLTALTTLTFVSLSPQWSPDGTRIVFSYPGALDGSDAANANSTRNIWVVDADGTDLMPLTEITALNANTFAPQWSPDATQIVFSATRAVDGNDSANANTTFNIWVVNSDGSGETSLTGLTADFADNVAPQWSPDGTEILFSSGAALDGSDAANDTSNLWIMNADGTEATAITTLTAQFASHTFPQWAP